MIEHRLPMRLVKYWETIKKDSPLPEVSLFRPHVLVDIWENCFKIARKVEEDKTVYKYEFVGKELESVFGERLVGKKVKAKLGFLPAQKMMDNIEAALINPIPQTMEGQFFTKEGTLIKYRACLLPFGTSKENVTHFIIGVSWKSFLG